MAEAIRCSNSPWRAGSSGWAPTSRDTSARGVTSPTPTVTRAGSRRRPLREQTLALGAADGRRPPAALGPRHNLANAYRDAGRVDEAIPLYSRPWPTGSATGADHPSTLNSRRGLAPACRDTARVDEAIPLLERALADRERVLGADPPDTVTTRNYLALAGQDAVAPGRTDARPLGS